MGTWGYKRRVYDVAEFVLGHWIATLIGVFLIGGLAFVIRQWSETFVAAAADLRHSRKPGHTQVRIAQTRGEARKRAVMTRGPGAVLALTLATGCAPIDYRPPIEGAASGLERWNCGDYFDGCGGFLGAECHVTLTADLRNGTGTVSFDNVVEPTMFQIEGIERRWNWCLGDDGGFDCSFLISPNGRARYYNFAVSEPDPDGMSRAKPTDLFKCTK